jgi:hypothetical protein
MEQGTKSKSASPQPVLSKTTNENLQRDNNPISRKLNKILESRIENDKVFLLNSYTKSSFVCLILMTL